MSQSIIILAILLIMVLRTSDWEAFSQQIRWADRYNRHVQGGPNLGDCELNNKYSEWQSFTTVGVLWMRLLFRMLRRKELTIVWRSKANWLISLSVVSCWCFSLECLCGDQLRRWKPSSCIFGKYFRSCLQKLLLITIILRSFLKTTKALCS